MPCCTPGTPSGNTGRRSPGSGFFPVPNGLKSYIMSENLSDMLLAPSQNVPQPARLSGSTAANRIVRRIRMVSTLSVGIGEGDQHFDASTRAGRRFRIRHDQVEPAPCNRFIAVAPGAE